MKRRQTIQLAALSAASLSWPTSFAHGDQHHSKKAGPVKKEQKDWGIAGDAKAVRRTIEVKMTDNMRFSPDKIEVRQGDRIRFVVHNHGKLMHEFVIGTKKENDEHAQMMIKFPNMEHDEPYMAHVKPKEKSELIWHFNKPGEFFFACLIAGHYQAGMIGTIKVVAR